MTQERPPPTGWIIVMDPDGSYKRGEIVRVKPIGADDEEAVTIAEAWRIYEHKLTGNRSNGLG